MKFILRKNCFIPGSSRFIPVRRTGKPDMCSMGTKMKTANQEMESSPAPHSHPRTKRAGVLLLDALRRLRYTDAHV